MSMLQRASMSLRGCLMRLRSRRDGLLEQGMERKDTRKRHWEKKTWGVRVSATGLEFSWMHIGRRYSSFSTSLQSRRHQACVLAAHTIGVLQGRLGRHQTLFCPNEQHKNHNCQTHRSVLDYTKLSLEFTIDMADLAACRQPTSTAYGHQHYLTDFNYSLLVSTAPYSPRLHSSSLPSSPLFFICRGISLSQLDLIWNDLYFRALSSIYLRYLATLTCSTFASFTSYLDQGQEKQIHIRGKIQLSKFGVFCSGQSM